MVKDELTQSQVRDLFSYREGVLYHRTDKGNFKCKGKAVGAANSSKRLTTTIGGKSYLVHRIIFLHQKGYLPQCLDHINGDYLDNRVENLRESSPAQNQWNCKTRVDNTSGYKNVYWDKNRSKWFVMLQINKRQKKFGSYGDIELAGLVAQCAREKYHGEFCYGN